MCGIWISHGIPDLQEGDSGQKRGNRHQESLEGGSGRAQRDSPGSGLVPLQEIGVVS